MSLQHPVSDLLTRVRNAQLALLPTVSIASSKLKVAIVSVLKEEGFIADYSVSEDVVKVLTIKLRYFSGAPVIRKLKTVSTPSLPVYKRSFELPVVLGGLGVGIVSTSQGLMTVRKARLKGLGGKILCCVE